jgi:hypothetical protein
MLDQTNFETYKLVKQEHIREYLDLSRAHWQFPVPTEFVVSKESEVCVPIQGRVYRCDLAVAKTEPDGHDKPLVIVEVFEDHGDDGHTNNVLVGFMLMPWDEMGDWIEKVRKGEKGKYGHPSNIYDLTHQAIKPWW